jgi:membrane protein YdbS with pleckstrin-like domain
LRYERYADRPDEIVVRSGWLWKRELVVPLDAIEAVDRAASTVRLGEGRRASGD